MSQHLIIIQNYCHNSKNKIKLNSQSTFLLIWIKMNPWMHIFQAKISMYIGFTPCGSNTMSNIQETHSQILMTIFWKIWAKNIFSSQCHQKQHESQVASRLLHRPLYSLIIQCRMHKHWKLNALNCSTWKSVILQHWLRIGHT